VAIGIGFGRKLQRIDRAHFYFKHIARRGVNLSRDVKSRRVV